MGIAELAPLHKKQRLIRRHQLANFKDPRVRQFHNDFSEHQAQRDKRGSLKRGANERMECVEMGKLLAEIKTSAIRAVLKRIALASDTVPQSVLHGHRCTNPRHQFRKPANCSGAGSSKSTRYFSPMVGQLRACSRYPDHLPHSIPTPTAHSCHLTYSTTNQSGCSMRHSTRTPKLADWFL